MSVIKFRISGAMITTALSNIPDSQKFKNDVPYR